MCLYSGEEGRKKKLKKKKLKRKLVGTVLCAIPKYILKTLNFYSQIIFSANRELGRDK